jgi:hypothetical protein
VSAAIQQREIAEVKAQMIRKSGLMDLGGGHHGSCGLQT